MRGGSILSLKEQFYSVLVVSSSENFNSALSEMLPKSKYSPVHIVSDVSSAKRCLTERSYDFVIVNSPLHDDTGIRYAIDTAGSRNTAVLLLIRTDMHDDIHARVVSHGVFTLPRPTSKATFTTALNWLASARERMRRFEKKALSIEEKMEEIRLVNKAKWLLISELKMDEPTAHRYIEKQAMDRCVSKLIVAGEIIKTYS